MAGTLRQIAKSNTKDKLVEFNDNLQPNDFGASGVQKSSPHSTFSRIEAVIVDFSKGKKEKAIVGQYNLTPEVAKYVSNLIILGDTAEFEKPDKALNGVGFVEQKINHYKKDEEGYSGVSKINIKYQPHMNSPWTISIEIGKGKVEKTTIGGINIAKGSYIKLHDSTVYISKKEMVKMMLTLRDYIQNFEMWAFKVMMEERSKIEQAERLAWKNAANA